MLDQVFRAKKAGNILELIANLLGWSYKRSKVKRKLVEKKRCL